MMIDLTIVVLTYNHEKWIEHTINSILKQKTGINYRILISDDASTDGTPELLKKMKAKYPEKIELRLQPKNLGAELNFMTTVKSVDSKYIGFCEGDDSWVGDEKIEKQLNFLNANKDISAVCSDCHLINEQSDIIGLFSTGRITSDKKERVFTDTEFIEASWRPIHISSLITYSDIATTLFPEWYLKTPILDTPFLMNLVLRSKVYYSPEVLATYRLHSASITHDRGFTKKYLLDLKAMFDWLNLDYSKKYSSSFQKAKNNREYRYFSSLVNKQGLKNKLKGKTGLLSMIFVKSSYSKRDIFYTLRKG